MFDFDNTELLTSKPTNKNIADIINGAISYSENKSIGQSDIESANGFNVGEKTQDDKVSLSNDFSMAVDKLESAAKTLTSNIENLISNSVVNNAFDNTTIKNESNLTTDSSIGVINRTFTDIFNSVNNRASNESTNVKIDNSNNSVSPDFVNNISTRSPISNKSTVNNSSSLTSDSNIKVNSNNFNDSVSSNSNSSNSVGDSDYYETDDSSFMTNSNIFKSLVQDIKENEITNNSQANKNETESLFRTMIEQNSSMLAAIENLGKPNSNTTILNSNNQIPQVHSSGPAKPNIISEVKENTNTTIMSKDGNLNTMLLMQIVQLLSGTIKTQASQW